MAAPSSALAFVADCYQKSLLTTGVHPQIGPTLANRMTVVKEIALSTNLSDGGRSAPGGTTLLRFTRKQSSPPQTELCRYPRRLIWAGLGRKPVLPIGV